MNKKKVVHRFWDRNTILFIIQSYWERGISIFDNRVDIDHKGVKLILDKYLNRSQNEVRTMRKKLCRFGCIV